MKEWGAALLLAGGVLVLCRIFGLLRASRAVFVRVETALATIGDPRLAEETKEDVLQREALALLRLFARLLASGAAALGLPAGVLWVFDWLGWISWRRVLEITVSAPFLLVVFGGALAWWWWWWRRNRSAARRTVGFENRYGALDRWLHHAAFASRPVQVALANLEDRAFRRRLPRAADLRPVFIAALPRAGTTMLLNVLAATGEFVTHTYRQMPFVLMPVWWDRFSRPFRASDRPRERAHGDGIAVSVDSPEAFEEVLWLTFWPEHYEPGRIRPWMAEENGGGFERFFREHLHKLPLVGRADATTDRRRYLSKNNANIARIAWLARRFPGARFVVPFRPPLAHAASLLRQHHNFVEIHARDPFARQYMATIGHFDFGADLRPIDFDGWLEQKDRANPLMLDYWLRYWLAGYTELLGLAQDARVRLVDYSAFCTHPIAGLRSLALFLDAQEPERWLAQAASIREPRTPEVDIGDVPPVLLHAAETLHASLVARARAQSV